MAIVRDAAILGGEPRIEGTRIGVRHVVASVTDADQAPAEVADQLDVSMADVHDALAYYDRNEAEIRDIQSEHDAAIARLRGEALQPKDLAE